MLAWALLFADEPRDALAAAQKTAERERLLATLHEKVRRPLEGTEGLAPVQMRRLLDQLGSEMERLELAFERLPQIGLVAER